MAQIVELMLRAEDMNVTRVKHEEDALDFSALYDYDLIVLGDLTGSHGLIKRLRESVRVPLLILSGLASVADKVRALNIGADDYMTKPFHKDELVARICALVRRSKGHAVSAIQTGNIVLNLTTKLVEVAGQRLHLTGKEYQMMELLSLRKGQTLSKEMFLNHLYGGMDEPEVKIVDVFMCKLRRKLREADGHEIETVWGRGYVLRDKPDNVSLAPEIADMIGLREGVRETAQ
jgi:two-component system, cell cycle response regulator CtrA